MHNNRHNSGIKILIMEHYLFKNCQLLRWNVICSEIKKYFGKKAPICYSSSCFCWSQKSAEKCNQCVIYSVTDSKMVWHVPIFIFHGFLQKKKLHFTLSCSLKNSEFGRECCFYSLAIVIFTFRLRLLVYTR